MTDSFLLWTAAVFAIVAAVLAIFGYFHWRHTRANKELGRTLLYLALGTNLAGIALNQYHQPSFLQGAIVALNVLLLGAAIYFYYKRGPGEAPGS